MTGPFSHPPVDRADLPPLFCRVLSGAGERFHFFHLSNSSKNLPVSQRANPVSSLLI